jgi:periplasmic protein TonB
VHRPFFQLRGNEISPLSARCPYVCCDVTAKGGAGSGFGAAADQTRLILRTMPRDLAIAAVLALMLYGGIVAFSECIGDKALVPAHRPSITSIEAITLPKVEPDEDEAVSEDRPQKPQPSFAPPVLNELPQIVLDTSFVQPIQPPVPGMLEVAKISISMPPSTGRQLIGFGEIFEMSKVDQLPEVIIQVPPDYPYQMRSAGIIGQVLVDCIVDMHGDVRNAFAATSSQHEFDKPAVRAVNNWKFEPGQRRGRPVNTHVQIPIVFSINQSPFQSGH